jgi:hypothetical protein
VPPTKPGASGVCWLGSKDTELHTQRTIQLSNRIIMPTLKKGQSRGLHIHAFECRGPRGDESEASEHNKMEDAYDGPFSVCTQIRIPVVATVARINIKDV